MRKMPGMEAAVRAKSTQLEGMSFVREDGRPCGVIRPTGNPDQQSLVSEYEILRGDLSHVLFDLTKDNDKIRYVFGEQVASIQQRQNMDGLVTVEFANGLPTSTYDLVVGCDGATSRTRVTGFECGVRDHMSPVNCWTAYFSIHRDLLEGSRIAQGHSAVGGRFISLLPDPAGLTRVMLMSIHPRDSPDVTLPFRNAAQQGIDALKEYVAERFRGSGWMTDEVLEDMVKSEDFYASEMAQVKMPKVYNGRVVLVGDAGYAAGPTGGGTSLALAGAYMLAGELRKNKGDMATGLRGYEERMRLIVDELQKIPPFVPDLLAPQTAWGIWLRNQIFAVVTRSGVLELVQRFFAGAFANSEGYKLPEYEWGEIKDTMRALKRVPT
jgi:2-polyprenyl-6-methoxyphenol hydroxylase-like FAD-dependent oxidoreductase